MSLITIVTSPKPFTNPHIAMIQRNAIRSWLALAPDVTVFLAGNEEGVAETAQEFGVGHLKDIQCNQVGTPLISSMLENVRSFSTSPFLAIVNTDILLTSSFVAVTQKIAEQAQSFVLMGQRYDLDIRRELPFGEGWQVDLQKDIEERGHLHPRGGSDYFIFPTHCYASTPDFAIGRAGWDNWMIYEARQRGWLTLDASGAIQIVHQAHDYSHLPGGKPHYRHPETFENIRLAGGKRAIFTLNDATHCIKNQRVKNFPGNWKKFWREVEIFPLIHFHSQPLAELFFAFFHPKKAYSEWRSRHKEA